MQLPVNPNEMVASAVLPLSRPAPLITIYSTPLAGPDKLFPRSVRTLSLKSFHLCLAASLFLFGPPRDATAQQRSSADEGSISGVVTDVTLQPVQGAIVSLLEMKLQSITGADGRFSFSSVPAGTFTLVARRFGYLPSVHSGIAGQTKSVSVRMVSSPLVVDPITVTATRTPSVTGSGVLSVSQVNEEALESLSAEA